MHDQGRMFSPSTLRQICYPFLIAVAGTADVGLLFLNRSLLISADSLTQDPFANDSQSLKIDIELIFCQTRLQLGCTSKSIKLLP